MRFGVNPDDLLFCDTHEWVRVEEAANGKQATIGISAFAVEQLNDVVYLELPSVGASFEVGAEFGVVESVKAVSSLYCPIVGEVIEVNSELPDKLETLSEDPYGGGWIIKVKITDDSGLSALMNHQAYQETCAGE